MTKKTIVIALVAIVLAAVAFSFYRARSLHKANKGEVLTFLAKFNWDLKLDNTDTLLAYFETKQNTDKLVKLLGLLSGKTDLSGQKNSQFNVDLKPDDSKITIINAELVKVVIPVVFSSTNFKDQQSSIVIRMRKISKGNFKIIQIDGRKFVTDFTIYSNIFHLSDGLIVNYEPITLTAFKTADSLKIKYDSVIWFAHVDKRSYFYVVKGKWDMDAIRGEYRRNEESIGLYKMGLVNPDMKEIIPVDYDLVYNISGTFPGLVEVEKDKKHGFYDLSGKIVVPVNYDQIFPLEDEENLAVLRNGNDYYYLKHDMSISEKEDIKVSSFFQKIKNIHGSYSIDSASLKVVTEYNSHDLHGMVYIAPSYLVDLNMIERVKNIKNPLRHVNNDEYLDDVTTQYDIGFDDKSNRSEDWITSMFYSITDNFLGGRSGLYTYKNLVLLDKKGNRVLTKSIRTDYSPGDGNNTDVGTCNGNSIKIINDSLFEVRAGAGLYNELYDSTKTIVGGTYYHYLAIRNNQLVELPERRTFGFTRYVKMDESYLTGCYIIQVGDWKNNKKETIDQVTPEMLRFMKNEIFADYRYQFKDKRWQEVFADMDAYQYRGDSPVPNNTTVDDSLTAIDKYNIAWINNRLKRNGQSKVLAAK